MEEQIIELCKKIKECRCPNCRAPAESLSCEYCLNVNNVMKEYADELTILLGQYEQTLSSINVSKIKINELFNYLYVIRKFGISKVDELLQKANYSNIIQRRLNRLIIAYEEDIPFSQEHYDFLLFLLFNKEFTGDLKMNWCNVLIKSIALKHFNIKQNDVEKLVILFSRELIDKICDFPNGLGRCKIINLPDGIGGCNRGNSVTISRKRIDELLTGDAFNIMNTNWHEIIHLFQNESFRNHIVSVIRLMQLKDNILSNSIPGYYEKNYAILSTELESFAYGAKYAIDYLKFLELPIRDEHFEIANNMMTYFNQNIFCLNRNINDKSMHLNDLFEQVLIKQPELLEKYPQLKLEYINENNVVRRKTLDEIENEYQSYLSGSLKLNGKEDEIKYYFEYLKNSMTEIKSRQA